MAIMVANRHLLRQGASAYDISEYWIQVCRSSEHLPEPWLRVANNGTVPAIGVTSWKRSPSPLPKLPKY